MKAKLTFDCEDSFERTALSRALKATDAYLVLFDIDNFLREKIKYAPDDVKQEVLDAYQAVRDKLHEILTERSVDLDDLE